MTGLGGSIVGWVKPARERRWVQGWVVVAVLAGLATAGLAACSDDEPVDYTAAHREAFLAACSRPLDDPRLLSDVCGCVYDRVEDEVSFGEFQRLDSLLAGEAAAAGVVADTDADGADADGAVAPPTTATELPTEIAQLVADCFTTEADL